MFTGMAKLAIQKLTILWVMKHGTYQHCWRWGNREQDCEEFKE